MSPSASVAPDANDPSIHPIVHTQATPAPAPAPAPAPKAAAQPPQPHTTQRQSPPRRIQVSREKRPLSFFISLARKSLNANSTVELSGLGLAVSNVITIAEVLRADGRAHIDDIQTSLVEPTKGHSTSSKPKIQIWLSRAEPNAPANCTDKQAEAASDHAGNTNPPESSNATVPTATASTHPSEAS